MRNLSPTTITKAFADYAKKAPDKRTRTLLVGLAGHLHKFVRENKVTQAEWLAGIDALTRATRFTDDKRNEYILFSDLLGVSSLVCLLNNGDNGNTETNQNLLGPFWRLNSPRTKNGDTIIRSPTPGIPMFVRATFTDTAGKPLEGAEVDVWQSNFEGLYENQDETQVDMNLRGKFIADANGEISCVQRLFFDADGNPILEGSKRKKMLVFSYTTTA